MRSEAAECRRLELCGQIEQRRLESGRETLAGAQRNTAAERAKLSNLAAEFQRIKKEFCGEKSEKPALARFNAQRSLLQNLHKNSSAAAETRSKLERFEKTQQAVLGKVIRCKQKIDSIAHALRKSKARTQSRIEGRENEALQELFAARNKQKLDAQRETETETIEIRSASAEIFSQEPRALQTASSMDAAPGGEHRRSFEHRNFIPSNVAIPGDKQVVQPPAPDVSELPAWEELRKYLERDLSGTIEGVAGWNNFGAAGLDVQYRLADGALISMQVISDGRSGISVSLPLSAAGVRDALAERLTNEGFKINSIEVQHPQRPA